jgi:hypothetical protein
MANVEIITRFELAFRGADQATIDELCDPGLVDHNPAPDEEPTLAGFKQKVAGFNAIFPDLEEDLQDVIASGDTVATQWGRRSRGELRMHLSADISGLAVTVRAQYRHSGVNSTGAPGLPAAPQAVRPGRRPLR